MFLPAPAPAQPPVPALDAATLPEPQKRSRRRRWSEDEKAAIEEVDKYLREGEEGNFGASAFSAAEAPVHEHLVVEALAGQESTGVGAAPFLDQESKELLEESRAARRAAQERVSALLKSDSDHEQLQARIQETVASTGEESEASLPIAHSERDATSEDAPQHAESSGEKEISRVEEKVRAAHQAIRVNAAQAAVEAADIALRNAIADTTDVSAGVSTQLSQSLDQFLEAEGDDGYVSVAVGPSEVVLGNADDDASAAGISVSIHADGSAPRDISTTFGPSSYEVRQDAVYTTSASIVENAMKTVLSRHAESGFLSFDSSAVISNIAGSGMMPSDQSTVPSMHEGTSEGTADSPGETPRESSSAYVSSPESRAEPLVQRPLEEEVASSSLAAAPAAARRGCS